MTSLYFSFQSRLTRLRNTGELLPWEYGRDIGPDEYQQVLSELFKQTNAGGLLSSASSIASAATLITHHEMRRPA